MDLSGAEEEDIARYLDVTRAEMLFSRGVILVEGDAEKFLLPVFAQTVGAPLDHLGVSICSVGGTNFMPYAKFLASLGIPFAVITDWDPRDAGVALGIRRAARLVVTIGQATRGDGSAENLEELEELAKDNVGEFVSRCKEHGVFLNDCTLEVDLFRDGRFVGHIIETLREHEFGPERRNLLRQWESDPSTMDREPYLAMIAAVGKGRFAHRLASRLDGVCPPGYIGDAMVFVKGWG